MDERTKRIIELLKECIECYESREVADRIDDHGNTLSTRPCHECEEGVAYAEALERGDLLIVYAPVPMHLTCPHCYTRHIDEGEWATRPHRTHLCDECGHEWRPANIPTVGVESLPSRGET